MGGDPCRACLLRGCRAIRGTIIARLGIPSFIVTLAGFLIFNGVMLILLLLGPFSGYPNLNIPDSNVQVLFNLMAGTIDPTLSWIAMAVIVLALGAFLWFGDRRRRTSGLVAPPVGLTVLKIALIAAAGIVVGGASDINRASFGTLEGVPWVVPIVLGILGAYTILLERTQFRRYIYAIGNAEAAHRAGINVAMVRTVAFMLCSMTAGIGLIPVCLLHRRHVEQRPGRLGRPVRGCRRRDRGREPVRG